jgi:hypothetical protein
VTAGGRLQAFWPADDGSIVAMSGRAGGRWGKARTLTAPLAVAAGQDAPYVPELRLAADGWLVWVDWKRGLLRSVDTGTAHSDALAAWISSVSRFVTQTR